MPAASEFHGHGAVSAAERVEGEPPGPPGGAEGEPPSYVIASASSRAAAASATLCFRIQAARQECLSLQYFFL